MRVRCVLQGVSLVDADFDDALLHHVKQLGGTGGLIAIDKKGEIAMPFNANGMYRGYVDPAGKFVVEIYR